MIKEDSIFAKALDKREEFHDHDFFIFATKHQSQEHRKTFSLHAPGNWDKNELGCKEGKTSSPSLLINLDSTPYLSVSGTITTRVLLKNFKKPYDSSPCQKSQYLLQNRIISHYDFSLISFSISLKLLIFSFMSNAFNSYFLCVGQIGNLLNFLYPSASKPLVISFCYWKFFCFFNFCLYNRHNN